MTERNEAVEAARRDYNWALEKHGPLIMAELAQIIAPDPPGRFKRGDRVKKVKGYPFRGWVVAAFTNRNGDVRYVVEHETERGMLHIYSEAQLEERLV